MPIVNLNELSTEQRKGLAFATAQANAPTIAENEQRAGQDPPLESLPLMSEQEYADQVISSAADSWAEQAKEAAVQALRAQGEVLLKLKPESQQKVMALVQELAKNENVEAAGDL